MKKKKRTAAAKKQNKINYEFEIKTKLALMLQKVDKRTYNTLMKYSQNFKKIKPPITSSYLFGKVGNGKTVHAAWMMFEYARLNCKVGKKRNKIYFITALGLFQEIKKTYDSKKTFIKESDIILKYQKAHLLVLDEFGLDNDTKWSFNILYQIIDYRYKNKLPTIYTSNDSLDQIANKLNDDRLTSRIHHDCGNNVLHFTGETRRKIV